MNNPFQLFYEQHADEVSHLWLLWHLGTGQPNQTQNTLCELERRLFTHIAGLMTEPDLSWELCRANLEFEQPAELFAAAQVAFRTYQPERIKTVVGCATESAHMREGLVSALAWLPGDICHPWVKKLLESKDFSHKALALAVCRARNEDPGKYLAAIAGRDECMAFAPLQDEVLFNIGVFKRAALLPVCNSEPNKKRFSALHSRVLLNEKDSAEMLQPYVFEDSEHSDQAIRLAFSSLPLQTARSWISDLARSGKPRKVLLATAILGDPHALPWLASQMKDPVSARFAGEAFSQITGVDLEQADLAGPAMIRDEQQWEEDALEVPADENLPWPNAAAVAEYCRKVLEGKMQSGARYFLGRPLDDQLLKSALRKGQQRHRQQAALLLALRHPGQPLVNVCGRQTPQS